jgi:hypothetical protein
MEEEDQYFHRRLSLDHNFMKIRPVQAEFFHADRQTNGHDEDISCFFENLRTRLKIDGFRNAVFISF